MKFQQLAARLEEVERRSARSQKIHELAQLFKEVELDELPSAVYLCQGRLANPSRKRETDHIRLKWEEVAKLLSSAPTETLPSESADLTKYPPLSISTLYELLHSSVAGFDAWLAGKKTIPPVLVEISRCLDHACKKWLARILIGPVFSDEEIISVLAKLAPSAGGTREAIEAAYESIVLDLGFIARTVAENAEQAYWVMRNLTPQPGITTKPEDLTNFRDDVTQAWRSFGPCVVQPKYDGYYVQILKSGGTIRLFDEAHNDLTHLLPDVVEAFLSIRSDLSIFDSEVVPFDPPKNRILSWKRTLTAKHHKAFVHDVIIADGRDWRNEPYSKRREFLIELFGTDFGQTLSAVHEELVETEEDLERLWLMWKEDRDYEGIIVKMRNGTYHSGQKTDAKGKVTPRVALDAVVLGFQSSSKNLTSVLVGLWDEKKERLIPFATVEGAIIPKNIRRDLWNRCLKLTLKTKPPQVVPDIAPRSWVQPRIVVEVETKGRKTRSDKYRHTGFTIQHKTGLRIRDNKVPKDANDIELFNSFAIAPGEELDPSDPEGPGEPRE